MANLKAFSLWVLLEELIQAMLIRQASCLLYFLLEHGTLRKPNSLARTGAAVALGF